MRHTFPALLALAALAACSGKTASPAPSPGSTTQAAPSAARASATAVAQASTAPGGARAIAVNTELYEFEYAYPAAAGAIPALRAALDGEAGKAEAELAGEAKEGKAEADKSGFDYRPYGYWTAWQVVTDLPAWLSLSTEVSTYEGGAHPNHHYDTLLWDKAAGQRRDPIDLFTSKEALSRVIRRPFCARLDAERARKRGGEKLDGMFDECIDPVQSTVILGSSNGHVFDRIGVLVAPYDAGPYAEGGYDVTLPVDAAILAVVRSEYRSAFAVKR